MHMNFVSFLKTSLVLTILAHRGSAEDHPDTYLSIEELAQKYGYPVESHEITTDDGYMLTLYRIPHGRKGDGINKRPVLMMHGLYGSPENYIVSGMDNASLAYYMADRGYDVWLGSSRGSKHGRKHRELNPNDDDFWNFSWHDIAMFDIPSKIDYILNKTGMERLFYVGHSQGGTVFYVMNSMKPEYQKKIVFASLLAPAGYMKNAPYIFTKAFVTMNNEVFQLMKASKMLEYPPSWVNLGDLILTGCTQSPFNMRDICMFFYHLFMGGDSGHFNSDMLPLVSRSIPSASIRQAVHYAQGIRTGHFRPFDFGEERNMELYGKPIPDDYPLGIIKVPTAAYYSRGDIIVGAKDIAATCDALSNCVRKFLLPDKKFTHTDFVFATNAVEAFHESLVDLADKYDM